MNATPGPGVPMSAETHPPLPEAVTFVLTKEITTDDRAFAAFIGGIVGALLLALICVIAALLWCLSRHKGSYVTNELDDDDDDADAGDNDDGRGHDIDDDNEHFRSDIVLQIKEPLKRKDSE